MSTQTLDRTSTALLASRGISSAAPTTQPVALAESAGLGGFIAKAVIFGAGAPLLLAAGLFKAHDFFGPEFLASSILAGP